MAKDRAELMTRLQKLQDTYEKARIASLGEDWETQMELRYLMKRVEEEIRATIQTLKKPSVV